MVKKILSNTLEKFDNLSLDTLKKIRVKSFDKRNKKVQECIEIYKYIYKKHYFLEDNNVRSCAYDPTYLDILEKFITKAENNNFPYIAKECLDSSNALSPLQALNEDLNDPDGSSVNIGAKKELSNKMLSSLLDKCSTSLFDNHEATELRKRNLRELLYTGNCFYQLGEIESNNKTTLTWKHIKMTEIAIEKEFNEIIYFFRKIKFSYNECEKYFGNDKYTMDKIRRKEDTSFKEENRNDKTIGIYETVCKCPDTGRCLIKYDLDDETYGFLEKEPRYRDYPVFCCQQINCIGEDELYGMPDDTLYQNLLVLKDYQIQYFNFQNKIVPPISNPEIYDPFNREQIQVGFDDGVNAHTEAKKINAELQNEKRVIDTETLKLFSGNLQNQVSTPSSMYQSFETMRQKIASNAEAFAKALLTPAEAYSFISQQDRGAEASVFELKSQQALSTDKILLNTIEVETSNKLKVYVEYEIRKMVQMVKDYVKTSHGEEELEVKNYIDLINLKPIKELEEMFEAVFDANINPTSSKSELEKHPFKILLENERILQLKSIIKDLEVQDINSQDEVEKIEIKDLLEEAYSTLKEMKKNFENLLENAKMNITEIRKQSLVHSFTEEQLMFFFSFATFNKNIKYQLASPEANAMRSVEIRNKNAYIDKALSYLPVVAQADPEEARKMITALDMTNNLRDGAKKLGIDVIKSEKETQKIMEAKKQQEMENQIKLIQAQQGQQFSQ